jgi:hypothetical protein
MTKISGSTLMFDEEEVKKTTEFLPRLIRVIFYYFGITNDSYLDRYRDFFCRMFPDKSRKEFSQKSVADRKVLLDRKQLTIKMLLNVLSAMGYDTEAVSIRIRDRLTGEVKEFSTDDTVEKIKSMLEQEREIGIQSL